MHLRRTRLLFLLFITTAVFIFLTSSENKNFVNEKSPFFKGKKEKKEEFPERIGEKIKYSVMLGKIRLGYAQYHHLKKTQLNGRPVNLITFETKLVRFYDLETIYSDTETSLPVLIERKVSRLIKPERIKEIYDQENFILTIIKKRWREEKIVIKKDGPIHNAILLPHFVRNKLKLDIGWALDINLPKRKYLIELVSTEEIQVPAGKFKTYYFESRPRQIKIWISADDKRIPVRIEGTGALGYKLLMQEYTLPERVK